MYKKIRKKDTIVNNKQEQFLDMILPDFKEGVIKQEDIQKTYFDLEESQKIKPYSTLKEVPLAWSTGVSYDEEREYTLSKKPKNRQNI